MLDAAAATITEERNARKEPLSDSEVRSMLKSVDRVVVAKGKKHEEFSPKAVKLDLLKGPTGNYRAPMVRRGKTLIVGFHPDSLEQLL